MDVTKIEVTDIIMIGNLFREDGYDKNNSADNLAELKGKIITEYLADAYPDVEICVDIAIQQEAGAHRPLEVLVYNGEESNRTVAATLQEQLSQKIEKGTADYSWAVKVE